MNALEQISEAARGRNLPFLVSGGYAVIAHGHQRTTVDLDLIIPREQKQLWLELASSLGYQLYHEASAFVQFNPPGLGIPPLDIMLVNQETFGKLTADAVPVALLPSSPHSLRVVSLRHLLALKCHAVKHGHPGRIVKDVDDVIRLVQVNRVNVGDDEIRQLFLKHGTPELYEKVQRVCARP